MGLIKDILRYGFEGSLKRSSDEGNLPLMDLPQLSEELVKRRVESERLSREEPLTVDSRLAHESLTRAENAYEEKFRSEVRKEVERQLRDKK